MSYEAFADVAARNREARESVARPARVRFFIDIDGTGECRMEGKSGLLFGAHMLEEPSFSYGVIAKNEIPIGGVPLCSAVVLKWRKLKDFYLGADIGFIVESSANVSLKFSLTFEGVTLRATLPSGVGEQ
jgi:hypothetical protein